MVANAKFAELKTITLRLGDVVKDEARIQDEIRVAAVGYGCILMRNNNGALKDVNGRMVRFGLGNDSKLLNEKIKSSDLIGFTRVTITPDMVGRTLAVFTAVEVKSGDWKPRPDCKREMAQQAFIDWIKANGGFAGFAKCWADFEALVGR